MTSTNLYSWTSAKGAALWVDLNFRSWLFGVYREGYPFRVGWYLHLGPLSVVLTRGRPAGGFWTYLSEDEAPKSGSVIRDFEP